VWPLRTNPNSARRALYAIAGIAWLSWIAGGTAARAQSTDPGAPPLVVPPPTDASGAWRPPPLEPDKKRAKDWLLLKSGEVLRGEIEYIREDKVQFDSDELEDLEIDWSDVIGFGSPRRNTYRFGNDVIVTGTAEMRAGTIRIDTGNEIREFPRSGLYSMIEGELREIDYWSLKAGLGLTLRSGNSDQTDLTARVDLKRETALTRTLASYESAFSEVESEEVTDNQRLTSYFAYFITTRTSLAAPIVELYRDRVRNVDLRTTVAAGVGYDVIDRPRVEWNVLGGAGYQRTEFASIEADEDQTTEDAALLFRTSLELDPIPDVDWDTTYTLIAVVTDWDKTSHHLSSVLSFEVWGPLDLDLSFIWDRIEAPAPDPDGDTPKSDDFQLTVGVSLEF
jgi:Protein of unknown function, DUF481